MSDADWQSVFERIDARREQLALTKSRLYELSGVSETTFQKMAAGIPLGRNDKRIGICRALRWTDDSIDLMLRGGSPLVSARRPLSEMTNEELVELAGQGPEFVRLSGVNGFPVHLRPDLISAVYEAGCREWQDDDGEHRATCTHVVCGGAVLQLRVSVDAIVAALGWTPDA